MIQSHKTQPWISSEKALTYFFYWNQGFPVHQGLVGWSWFSIGRSRKHTSVYTFIVLFFGAWECEWAWYSPDSIWICFHDMTHISESYWMTHTLKCRKMVPVIPTSSLVAAAGVWVFLLLKSWVKWCIKTKQMLISSEYNLISGQLPVLTI